MTKEDRDRAQARADKRRQADAQAAQAADLADAVTHPHESPEQRARRREAAAEKERLRALGVKFDE